VHSAAQHVGGSADGTVYLCEFQYILRWYADLVCVWQDGGVVLGAQIGLHTLAVLRATIKDVATGGIPAHKGDGLFGSQRQELRVTDCGGESEAPFLRLHGALIVVDGKDYV
jgi:hypothetical protein